MRPSIFNLRYFAAICVSVALGACGGGSGGGNDDPDFGDLPYEERIDAVALLGERLGAFSNTAFSGTPSEFPSTGTAAFSGYAVAVLDTAVTADLIDALGSGDDPRLLLVGTATLDADFAARTITGSARDFFGKDGGDFGDYDGTVSFLDGQIGISSSASGSRPNDVRFRYVGTLTGQGNDVVLSGNADGKFKGTPIRGLIASDLGSGNLNGAATPSFFGVVAEKN